MSSQGIQTLLEAEKEASIVVQKARQYRLAKIKDARAQSQKEIESLKAHKNAEFAAFEKTLVDSAANNSVDTETDAKILEIQAMYEKNKTMVIQKLLSSVVNVNPEPHVNARYNWFNHPF